MEVQAIDDLFSHTGTPYGPVIQTLRMARHRGTELEVLVAVPRALLWMLFQVSPPWTDFLAASLPRACSHVCLYMDDVRPGNQHRPDKGRLYYAWYYQLVDLPYWFRVSAQGWFDLCFVKASDCEGIVGGFGCLTDRLLSMINFPFTVDVPSPGFASESSRGSARES